MTTEDSKRVEQIAGRVARFQFGKTIQICADMKFLLEVIEKMKEEVARLRSK